MLEQATSNKTGWSPVAFGDVVDLSKERSKDPESEGYQRVVGLEHIDPSDLRIRRWANISDGTTFSSVFRPGQVLFGKRRAYQRKVAAADFAGVCSGDIYVLEPCGNALIPELLPFICQSDAFFEHAVATSAGSLSPRTNWKSLASFEFLLPPIHEQVRLVNVLSAHRIAMESIQNAKIALEQTQEAFIEDLLINKHAEAPLMRVSELLTEGPRNGKSPPASDREMGFQTVSISAVSGGMFDPEGCIKFVDIDPVGAKNYVVHKGDAFAVRGNGNRMLMGKVGLCTKDYGDLIYPDLLIRLRFNERVIFSEFAVALWNHPSVHARLASRAKSSNGIWKVNGQDIRAHTLKVPHVDDQREAVAVFSHFQSQSLAMRKRRRELLLLQKKLHVQAFGEG